MSSVLRRNLRIKVRGAKQAGYVITTELVLLAAALLVGTIIGWIAIRDALLQEMFDFASAIVAPPIDPLDPVVDPVTPTDPGPSAPVYTEIPFLDVVDPDPLALVVITEKVSILDCISSATRYNINIAKVLGGDLTGQCEVLLNDVPDPSTIPADIENIVFLLLIDPVTGLTTDRVSIADCMARLATASAGQIYIEDLTADGIGSCTILP